MLRSKAETSEYPSLPSHLRYDRTLSDKEFRRALRTEGRLENDHRQFLMPQSLLYPRVDVRDQVGEPRDGIVVFSKRRDEFRLSRMVVSPFWYRHREFDTIERAARFRETVFVKDEEMAKQVLAEPRAHRCWLISQRLKHRHKEFYVRYFDQGVAVQELYEILCALFKQCEWRRTLLLQSGTDYLAECDGDSFYSLGSPLQASSYGDYDCEDTLSFNRSYLYRHVYGIVLMRVRQRLRSERPLPRTPSLGFCWWMDQALWVHHLRAPFRTLRARRWGKKLRAERKARGEKVRNTPLWEETEVPPWLVPDFPQVPDIYPGQDLNRRVLSPEAEHWQLMVECTAACRLLRTLYGTRCYDCRQSLTLEWNIHSLA